MSRFVLTAQLQLQAPTNVGQVVNQIQSQLNNVRVNVQVQGAAQATRQINQVTQATQRASSAASQLGKNFGLSIKRFAAFSIATRAVSLFTSGLSKAIKEAIAFERELIKISQVTGKTIGQLRDLTNEITKLSTGLGVSSTSLLSTSRILSQAGLSADETKIALDALAKSTLAPTFDDIGKTAEGVVAIFNQFQAGAEALEAQLGAINAVAGRFAVEAGDLISVVRRTGGVFRAAGGELNELIALFTSVRATTRESAESIATGLRTIFTRIQRPKTIEFLRQYGVELLDLEGKFVGPFEATKRLSEALAGLEQGDITFVQIAEELGGFRQIGKVIPLLQQFRVAQEALNVAQEGSGSLAEDAASAQAALAVRITKVKEEFLALIRSISESTSFQLFANTALNLASALIKLAEALKPILPLLTAFAAIKLATGFGSFVRGIGSGLRSPRAFASGGLVPGSGNRDTVPAMLTPGEFVIRKSSVAKLGASNLAAMNANGYAKGGQVVLRVKPNKFGGMFLSPPTEADSSINSPTGRLVTGENSQRLINKLQMSGQFAGLGAGLISQTAARTMGQETKVYSANAPNKPNKEFLSFLKKNNPRLLTGKNMDRVNPNSPKVQKLEQQFLGNTVVNAKVPKNIAAVKIAANSGSIPSLIANTSDMNVGLQDEVTQIAYTGMKTMVQNILNSNTLSNKIGPERLKKIRPNIKKSVAKLFNNDPKGRINSARASIEGYLLEGLIGGITGSFPESGGALFDFMYPGRGDNEGWADLFGPRGAAQIALLTAADAKRSATRSNKDSIVDKVGKYLSSSVSPGLLNQFVTMDPLMKSLGGLIQKFATGGAATGTDTVPALLTPGEFVINRSSAQRIGYGNLNRMNKVGKYANGGVVQRFAKGGPATSTTVDPFLALTILPAVIQSLLPPIDETSSGLAKATNRLLTFATTVASVGFALQMFGAKLSLKSAGGFLLRGRGGAALGDTLIYKSGLRNRAIRQRVAGIQKIAPNAPRSAAIKQAVGEARAGTLFSKGGIGKNTLLAAKSLKTLSVVAAKAVGPLLLLIGVNKIFSAFRDLDGKLKDAIKAQDTARAQQLAVSKAASESIPIIGNIVGAIGDFLGPGTSEAIVGFFSLFGGPSVASIKANIDAQIKSAKAQKSLQETAEKAAEAMKEFEAGNISAAEAAKAAAASSQAIYESRLATEQANKENTALKSTVGRGAIARNIFTLGGLFGETASQRNRRIDQENQKRTDEQKKLEDEQFKVAQPAINAFGRQLAATGGNFDQFKEQLLAMGFSADFVRRKENDLRKSFENIAKEAERTRKAFDAMNLGFRNIQSVSGALSVSMNNYLASQEAGYNQLENVISTLEASVTSAAAGISDEDFGSALGFAAAGLRDLGASNEQINKFTENLTAINKAQQIFSQASKEAKQALIDEFERGVTGQSSAGPTREKFAEVIANQLEQAGIGEATRERIKDAIANADISQDDLNEIIGGNVAVLDKVLNDLGETTLKQVIGPLKELAKYQSQLVNITKKRLELENNLIQAQRNLLSAQLEAQEIIAKYGGPAVTPEIRRQNILDQANLQASRTGVGALRTGSAAELNARSQQARARLAEIGSLRAEAARQGPQGDVARQRLSGEEGAKLAAEEKRLQELAKSDYETTKQLIQLKEEELKLIQEKNRLEKSSIEALITGDIAKFFEQQAAVGATAAIALGNDSLQNAFGPQALGQAALDIQKQQQAGVQSLYGQQLGGAGGLVERGFGAAISARGVGGAGALSMAQMAAGTTAEEEAARSEIRSLAATLPNYAETQLQVAQQDKTTADIQYQAAQMQLQAAKETARARGVDIAGMARGGVVYANRGIFVPKGTDTVPAMLTPGEFVVRREAVRRGNNLQLLQSMNRGQSGVSNNGAVAMADGGVVYARRGIFLNRNNTPSNTTNTPQIGVGLSPEVINNLSISLNKFNTDLSANIDRLNNTSFNVKLDTTNINVNLNGGSFLSKLKEDLKNELLLEVGNQIRNASIGQDGRLKTNPGVV